MPASTALATLDAPPPSAPYCTKAVYTSCVPASKLTRLRVRRVVPAHDDVIRPRRQPCKHGQVEVITEDADSASTMDRSEGSIGRTIETATPSLDRTSKSRTSPRSTSVMMSLQSTSKLEAHRSLRAMLHVPYWG